VIVDAESSNQSGWPTGQDSTPGWASFAVRHRWNLGLGLALLVGLYLASRFSYLLFHTLAELFTVVVASSIFIIAWNARTYIQNGYLLFVGIGYLAIGLLDLLHTLGYAGMPVFPGYGFIANQLWIAARFMESVALLGGFVYLRANRRPNPALVLSGFALVTALAIATIFVWRIFPVCFVPGQGQTRFKILSECVIIAILALDAALLIINRRRFERGIYLALLGATLLAILTESTFTIYVNNFDLSNRIGHFLKVFSFYLTYVAIVKNGVERPYELVFRELAETNHALERSEQLLQLVLDTIPMGVFWKDRNSKYLGCNQYLANISGLPDPKAIAGLTDFQLPWRTLAEVYQADDSNVMATRSAKLNFEEKIILPDEVQWVRTSKAPLIDRQGEVFGMFGMFEDITARKQAEEATREKSELLQLLLQSTSEAIYGVDEKGICTFCNEAFLRLFGYPRAEQILGRNMHDLIHHSHTDGSSYPVEDCPIFAAFQSGKEMHVLDEVLWKADGSCFPSEYWSQPLHRHGSNCGAVVTCLDITGRKQVERERAELENQGHRLKKANSLALMAGSVAHHFNNKLQSVTAALELLGRGPKVGDPAKYLTMAKTAAEKAAEVSRSMLVYLGQTTSAQEPHALSVLCQNCLPDLQSALPRAVHLTMDFTAPDPTILASEDLVKQVLTVLVTNAWESMGVAGGLIRIGSTTYPAGTLPAGQRFPPDWEPQPIDYACLEVSDTGCGIPDPDIEKLFDPFFSTKFAGRGLGLPMCLGLVQAHGGVILVESRQHRGSAFRVCIPVTTQPIPSRADSERQTGSLEAGGTVLVVDDDEPLLEATGEFITLLGFRLLTAKDGVEAVEVFRLHRAEIRCVITDLTMPRMGGWETLAALRQLAPDLPVILSSGYDQAQVMAGDHQEAPHAFLGKPYNLQKLEKALNQALGRAGEAATR
jgi:PAS domain S-box-containing protein